MPACIFWCLSCLKFPQFFWFCDLASNINLGKILCPNCFKYCFCYLFSFFFWYFPYAYITPFVVLPQSLDTLFFQSLFSVCLLLLEVSIEILSDSAIVSSGVPYLMTSNQALFISVTVFLTSSSSFWNFLRTSTPLLTLSI